MDKTIIIKSTPSSQDMAEKNNVKGVIDFYYLCLSHWKWFVLSFSLCLGIAILFLLVKAPMYTRTASVHIKEDANSSSISSSISEEFANLGLGSGSRSVANEVVAFNSPELAEQVVKKMRLNIRYQTPKGLRRQMLYAKTLPISIQFAELPDEATAKVYITLSDAGELTLESVKCLGKRKEEINQPIAFEEPVATIAGTIVVKKTEHFAVPTKPMKVIITHRPLSKMTQMFHTQIHAVQNSTENAIIDITYSAQNIQLAEDVINTLIAEYNKNWIKDKNELGVLTSQFIDERIRATQMELGIVDADIASYMSDNLITEPQISANILLNQASSSDIRIMALNNQIQMCSYLHDYVVDTANMGQLIPANVGIESSEVTSLVTAYNQQLLRRNTYVENSSEQNPLVRNLDTELRAQRSAIIRSLENTKLGLETELQSATKAMNQSSSKLSDAPIQQKTLISMNRQQTVKEALYLFLLQKREENEISQAFSAYNTRIISRPMGLNVPSSPKKSVVLLVAMLLGLLLPIIVLYLHELLYTKVRGRTDLEQLTVPFIGEIPYKNIADNAPAHLVVQQGNRGIINEAFRIVRSNLTFMLRPNTSERRQVVLITSANPGSGKTFISLNLAAACSFANNTKVVLVDLDIRKASLSKYLNSPKVGISDYLGGFENDWHTLVQHMDNLPNLDVLPVGAIPPNPAELLHGEKMTMLINQLKQEYDIIFLDMPPAEVVADVSIVKQWVDISLFVIRVGLFDRTMLPMIERYYQDGYFPNLAVLLNGSQVEERSYGYGYGHYGYGYGYGYGTEKQK